MNSLAILFFISEKTYLLSNARIQSELERMHTLTLYNNQNIQIQGQDTSLDTEIGQFDLCCISEPFEMSIDVK